MERPTVKISISLTVKIDVVEPDQASRPEPDDAQRLAKKVLAYLGENPEHAMMTFAEDGSTFQDLIDLARKVRDSERIKPYDEKGSEKL